MSCATVILGVCLFVAADEIPVSSADVREDGVRVHRVTSPYQAGTIAIRVLLPESFSAVKKYPAVYVLPVEAEEQSRYGEGLTEVISRGLHKQHAAIFVFPTFSHLPWYADHPTDPTIRQETYFLKVVLPLMERTYPVLSEPTGRLLVGFSKSGWGAWSLLLRHPEIFGRAAAWDAPLMLDQPNKYGTAPIFGTPENFSRYRITSLLAQQGPQLGPHARLILVGHGNFRPEHEAIHKLMKERGVPHVNIEGPVRKHDWHSGWLPEAVDLLLKEPAGQ